MNFTKGIKGLALTTAFIGGISFLPNSAGAETLGWSEDTGYVNDVNEDVTDSPVTDSPVTDSPVMYAADKPDSHTASVEYASKSNPDTERVTATTKWKDVEHYSRARYESVTGKIASDSERVYGKGYSQATSKWFLKSLTPYVAKTYWGID